MRIAAAIVMLTFCVCTVSFGQTSTVGFMHAIHATDNVDKTLKDPGGLNIEMVESTN